LERIEEDHPPDLSRYKRLKFTNRNLLQLDEIELILMCFLVVNLNTAQRATLRNNLKGCDAPTRICELVRTLISLAWWRVDRHVDLFQKMCDTIRWLETEQGDNLALVGKVLTKAALTVYDSMPLLERTKDAMLATAQLYRVPVYYYTESSQMELRSSYLAAYKSIDEIIEELELLSETLAELRSRHSDKMERMEQRINR